MPDTPVNAEADTCRICLESAPVETLHAQCNCKGTARLAHDGCIDEWRRLRNPCDADLCEVCLAQFVRSAERPTPRPGGPGRFLFVTGTATVVTTAFVICIQCAEECGFVPYVACGALGFVIGASGVYTRTCRSR
jgi:hypothetical protein